MVVILRRDYWSRPEIVRSRGVTLDASRSPGVLGFGALVVEEFLASRAVVCAEVESPFYRRHPVWEAASRSYIDIPDKFGGLSVVTPQLVTMSTVFCTEIEMTIVDLEAPGRVRRVASDDVLMLGDSRAVVGVDVPVYSIVCSKVELVTVDRGVSDLGVVPRPDRGCSLIYSVSIAI